MDTDKVIKEEANFWNKIADSRSEGSKIPETGDLRRATRVIAKKGAEPADRIMSKMVEGRINKFCKEHALLEQEYVKNPDMTVNEVLVDAISKLGENISIARFSRFQLGEQSSSSAPSDSEDSE